jgi:hypothetical protein
MAMRKWYSPIRWLAAIWRFITGPWLWHLIKELIVRTYALAILILVLGAGYWAVRYLVRTVFEPPQVPGQITNWQAKLDAASLRTEQHAGVERPAQRPPMGHYHQVDQWFQPDPFNGCTLAGCHEPLPHGKKAKVAAFMNFHTTFLDCRMCHEPQAHTTPARWISTQDNQPVETPVILQLIDFLEQNAAKIESDPATVHPKIVDLLRRSVATLGGDGMLDQLLSQIESTQPGSPVWRDSVSELISELPNHARGEYRAKLTWTANDRAAEYRNLSQQTAQYFANPKDDSIKHQIHAPLAKDPASCLSCHEDAPAMLDFSAAGYSPLRAKYLSDLQVARMIQHIREGQDFYLPNMEGP